MYIYIYICYTKKFLEMRSILRWRPWTILSYLRPPKNGDVMKRTGNLIRKCSLMMDGCWFSHASRTKIIKHQSFGDQIMRYVSILLGFIMMRRWTPKSPDAMRSERKSPKVISASSSILRLGGCLGVICFSSMAVVMRKGWIHASLSINHGILWQA